MSALKKTVSYGRKAEKNVIFENVFFLIQIGSQYFKNSYLPKIETSLYKKNGSLKK